MLISIAAKIFSSKWILFVFFCYKNTNYFKVKTSNIILNIKSNTLGQSIGVCYSKRSRCFNQT